MLQSGASRELFEAWAPDKKNGIIVSGYSVPGTLANDLMSEPDTVTVTDGQKINVRATIKFITFSAHSDYDQTSEFIRRIGANVVVLVHGQAYTMNRMRTKLEEDFTGLKVVAPENCQTISVRVPVERSAEAVGQLAEDLNNTGSAAKRGRKEAVTGLLVEDPGGSRILLSPEDLTSYTSLSVCKVEQAQRFAFPHSLAILCRALREIYDDVEVADGSLLVCGCVHVGLAQQILSIVWDATPLADMVADSVSFTALELARSPFAVQALQAPEDPDGRELKLVKVLCTYLQQEFGGVEFDEAKQTASFEVDGGKVSVDFPSRGVTCDSEALRERVRKGLRRCETSLRPLPQF
eukprot:gnl/TRDRNA2_/TRDRNA2_133898_c1_seq2.p1 gnl/TRDRNA2_/TRDRNA2_133898_c1~~gnl/TRDRNA2_/TRDRNA2_133898_c1_seq2.p1  ORF type:complete len:351 (+),score=64.47 gnl/TRDRNA2_/TRDRNA2_133898_c1_seq2:53-1105(+)